MTKKTRPPLFVYPHAHLPVLTAKHVPKSLLMQTLFRAVSSRRAMDSMAEAKFVAWLCNRLPVSMLDGAGNIHVDLRQGPQHRTMFTAHTDTVHRAGGPNEVRLDETDPNHVRWRAGEGACLGADDGAGIALMVHMINRGVPGLYVFFRGEEHGGVGSTWLAREMGHALKDIDRCVSFDRAGYTDVITHQFGGRCCSDQFAEALASALTNDALTVACTPDPTGSFTDSANMTELISECTNLSVGYKHQHGDGEWQDVTFLQELAEHLLTVAWDTLPVVRQPGEEESFAKGMGLPLAAEEHEQFLIAALNAAADGWYLELRGIVCEWLNPEDPQSVQHMVKMSRIDDVTYKSYAEGLEQGTDEYTQILEIVSADVLINV